MEHMQPTLEVVQTLPEDISIRTLASYPPEETSRIRDGLLQQDTSWPLFLYGDPVGGAELAEILYENYSHYTIVVEDLRNNRVVGRGHSLPFFWGGDKNEMPRNGWDDAVVLGLQTLLDGLAPNRITATEIAIDPRYRGLAAKVLGALRDAAFVHYDELIAPIRPTGIPAPGQSFEAYVASVREPDGLPIDPWIRIHVRAGGEIVKVAEKSMAFGASLAQWRTWTGLPFDRNGLVDIGALGQVECDLLADEGWYEEKGLWIRHTKKPLGTLAVLASLGS
jgi:hypothetical protein